MSAHSKHAHARNVAEKPGEPHKKSISGEEGKISGISKTKHRLRGIKLAATAAVLALGLAATPASARSMSSLNRPTDLSPASAETFYEPEGFMIKLPDEFAAFPKADSVSARTNALEQESGKFSMGNNEEGESIFQIMESNACLRIFVGNASAIFLPMGSEGFMLDFSSYGMQNPVPKMEKGKDGRMTLHILDAGTKTDLTLSFSPGVSSVGEVKAKVYREGRQESQSDPVSKSISGIINLGEEILENEKPKTIEEAREVYGRMGAEMVNQLREKCSALPPEEAAKLANAGQAVIAAVLLRIYVSKDEKALMELDRLRADPNIDKKKLESFAGKNGVLKEFRKIWPQCSASSEE